jgi:predicted dehydrogenase
MSSNVAIIGAGSIGNHLAYSCRKLDWHVDVFDTDATALSRFRSDIYPSRYGIFDEAIQLKGMSEFGVSQDRAYEVILIGTPPDTHYSVLLKALVLKPKVIMIEKPITGPDMNQIAKMREIFKNNPQTTFLCGYNHKVNIVTKVAEQLIRDSMAGDFVSLEVSWQESWAGILKAHPWLENHNSSYLGFYKRGGGALFEHSHGLDIWLHFSRILNLGRVHEVSAVASFENDVSGKPQYDTSIEINLKTTKSFKGTVKQDVTTLPSKKQVEIQTKLHKLVIGFNDHALGDFVVLTELRTGDEVFRLSAEKSRPFDFDLEIHEISRVLTLMRNNENAVSNLSGELGLETAHIASVSMESALSGVNIKI